MRSKSDGIETRANGVLGVPQGNHAISQEEEEMVLPVKKLISRVQQEEEEDKMMVVVTSGKEKLLTDSSEGGERKADIVDLTRKDLLKLLGIMEGEVQVGGCCSPIWHLFVSFKLQHKLILSVQTFALLMDSGSTVWWKTEANIPGSRFGV